MNMILSSFERNVHCPLCNAKVSNLICPDCINTGRFDRSNHCGESYQDMLICVVRLQGSMDLMRHSFEASQHAKLATARLEAEVALKKKKIVALRAAIDERRMRSRQLREELLMANSKVTKNRASLNRWRNSFLPFTTIMNSTQKKISILRLEVNDYNNRLRRYCKSLTKDLLGHVLPVQPLGKYAISMKYELEDFVDLEVVNGRVMEHRTSFKDVSVYSVADLILSISDLQNFRATDFEELPLVRTVQCPVKSRSQVTCRVINNTAALTHLCLLVNSLACLYGIHLPHILSLADFNDHSLSQAALSCLVNKLSINTIYFCLISGVQEQQIFPVSHTISNLLLLIDNLPIRRDEQHVALSTEMELILMRSGCFLTHSLACCKPFSKRKSRLRSNLRSLADRVDNYDEEFQIVDADDL